MSTGQIALTLKRHRKQSHHNLKSTVYQQVKDYFHNLENENGLLEKSRYEKKFKESY